MKKSKNKRILITGLSGLLGNNLAFYFKNKFDDIIGWYCSHKILIDGVISHKVDITSAMLESAIKEDNPDIIIHCASLAVIDFCETHRDLAKVINTTATQRLVEVCKDSGIKLVYISTDSVYDGSKSNFVETDTVNPLNYYGQTKYEGEQAVLEMENALILRTNIFGINIQEKNSIAEWIISDLSAKKPIRGFKDARFSSLYTFELARLLELALDKDLRGIYNCASRTSLTKYEFACRLADYFGFDKKLICPISIDDSFLIAKRGKNLSLNVEKISRDLRQQLPTIEESLGIFFRDYKSGLSDLIKDSKYSGTWYPVLPYLPYSRQSIDDDDISAVVDILKSSNLTQGRMVSDFEQALCDYTGAKFCVSFNSGTSALHAACLSAGLNEGDEFITSPNTFVASANCGVYCRARPVFADIDSKTYNIDPLEVRQKINKNTRVVIPVHFAGQICDMESIQRIVKEKENNYKHKIYIIEDASHALGSLYKGTKAGSNTYSDMTVMSFHPVKHITTGEGGVVLTNDEELYFKLKRFRSHGITSAPEEFLYKDEAFSASGLANPWYYEQQSLGYNYRITDIQCALGISQLKKLPFFIRQRQKVSSYYNEAFSKNGIITVPYQDPQCISNWHLYVLGIDFKKAGIERFSLMHRLRKKGIQTRIHYIPVHTQPYYQKNFGYKWGDYPVIEQYYRRCLSIPIFSLMSKDEAQRVVYEITAALENKV